MKCTDQEFQISETTSSDLMTDINELEYNLPMLDDIDFNAFTDQELVSLDSELSAKVSFLEVENIIYDTFLVRMLPSINIEEALETGKNIVDDGKEGDKTFTRRDKKKKAGDKKEVDRPFQLCFEQKNEIAIREMEELRDVFAKERDEWAKVFDNFKVLRYFIV